MNVYKFELPDGTELLPINEELEKEYSVNYCTQFPMEVTFTSSISAKNLFDILDDRKGQITEMTVCQTVMRPKRPHKKKRIRKKWIKKYGLKEVQEKQRTFKGEFKEAQIDDVFVNFEFEGDVE